MRVGHVCWFVFLQEVQEVTPSPHPQFLPLFCRKSPRRLLAVRSRILCQLDQVLEHHENMAETQELPSYFQLGIAS